MKPLYSKFFFFILLLSTVAKAQENENAALLKIIFSKYYSNEKVIVKSRLQLLDFYCKKAPNIEEVLEVIANNELVKKNATEIKKQIIFSDETWEKEYNIIFNNQNQYLKTKVNNCMSFEDYKIISDRFGENNQRLMIVSKPIYFANANFALVKVAFYRSIEHNSSSYLLFEKVDGIWAIKDYLNQWSS